MTIDSAYFPEKRNNHGGTVYQFEFEIIDPAYIKIYSIDAAGGYTPINPADYTVTVGTYIAPISRGGSVIFDDPLDVSVVAISIQRKTDISDYQDFTTGQPFNAESFEFQADKLTMILQEINASVCDCSGSEKRYCDAYACDAFVLKLAEVFDNVYPFDGSSPGFIGKNPTVGLAEFGPVGPGNFGHPSIIFGSCIGVTAGLGTASAGWRNLLATANTTYVGSFGGQIKINGPDAITIMQFKLNNSSLLRLWYDSVTQTMRIQVSGSDDDDIWELYTPGSSSRFVVVNFEIIDSDLGIYRASAYVDFVYHGPFEGTLGNMTLGGSFRGFYLHSINGTGASFVQNMFWNPSGVLTEAGNAALAYEYARNNPYFIDPDPGCVSTNSWTPAQIPTYLWFDANNAASITAPGNVVTTWGNIGDGPSGLNATNTVAGERPSIVASVLNGLPIIRFDGTTDNLEYTVSNSVGRNTGSILILAVTKEDADNAGVIFSVSRSDGTASRAQITKKNVGGRRLDADAFASTAGTNSATAWGIAAGLLDSTNSDARFYSNGALESENLTWQTPGNTSDTASPRFRIGSSITSTPGNYFDGDIAEIIMIQGDANTTTANRQLCEGYLAHKWGLESLLPVDHPYKASPP